MSRDSFLRNFRNSHFSESLEDENIKLLEMIRQREKTIKNLEVKTRNALEISIKADDGKTGRVRGHMRPRFETSSCLSQVRYTQIIKR